MFAPIDTGALLSRSYPLPGGERVRLRLARGRDRAGLAGLLERHGVAAGDLDLERLLRYDPRRRLVICASAPLAGTEVVVAFGAIDLEEGAQPDTLVVDPALEGLVELLAGALVGRMHSHVERVA